MAELGRQARFAQQFRTQSWTRPCTKVGGHGQSVARARILGIPGAQRFQGRALAVQPTQNDCQCSSLGVGAHLLLHNKVSNLAEHEHLRRARTGVNCASHPIFY